MIKKLSNKEIYLVLGAVLLFTILCSLCIGAIHFSFTQVVNYLSYSVGLKSNFIGTDLDKNIFIQLRLPRVLLCGIAGAGLSVSGVLMQGLFRNPIVEPGLTGTSAGAAFGAAIVFVFGKEFIFSYSESLGVFALPFFAFIGAFAASIFVYKISSSFSKVNVFVLLLSGIAVTAVCNAGTSFLSYLARDPQARSITFWGLGTFSTANWKEVFVIAVVFVVSLFLAIKYSKILNALLLGEDEANYLGINIKKTTFKIILLNTLLVATITAMVGIISFVGLIVPHLIRILKGSSNHKFLIPSAALLGAILMEWIDIVSRIIIPPAELPIGIITAIVGSPVFLFILIKQQNVRT